MGGIDALLENLDLAEVVIAYPQLITRLSGINGIGAKIKGSTQHRKAASWSEKFRNLSHPAILVNTAELV